MSTVPKNGKVATYLRMDVITFGFVVVREVGARITIIVEGSL